MNQAQEIQQLCKEYKQSLYKDHPDVERFEKQKRNWLLFLLCFSLVIVVTKALVLWQFSRPPIIVLIVGSVMGMGMNLIFLAASMGPNWKVAFVLYLWFFYNLFNIVTTLIRQGITSMEAFMWAYIDGFSEYPLAISNDILSWIFILLLLPTAVWLTLIPRNRRLAEQSNELNTQLRQFVAAHPIK